MYEELLSGDERGQSIIDGLVNGPKDDEEDEHIHHLLKLLDQPQQPTSGNTDIAEEVEEPVEEEENTSGEVVEQPSVSSIAVSENGADVDQGVDQGESGFLAESVEGTLDGDAAQDVPAEKGALNFLQDDELGVEGDDDFEVLEMPSAHEVCLPFSSPYK